MEKPENLLFSNRDLYNLFIPILIEQTLALGVGLADSMMVAQVSEAAVSGVSLVDFIMALLINIFGALASGGAVVVGQYYGMKSTDTADQAGRQMTQFSFFFSLFIMAAIFLLREPILNVLFGSVPPEVRSAAGIYFNIVVPSIPFIALYNCGAAMFRTMGNSKLPMAVMTSMNVLNIAGNAVLVFVFRMGVAGIAIPTFASRFGAAVIILALARRPGLELHLRGWLTDRFCWPMVRRILNIGAPFAFESGMFSFGRLLVLTIVARFGTAAIAANSVAGSIGVFQTLPGLAVNLGHSVIVSRCIGAGREDQAQWYTSRLLRFTHLIFLLSNITVGAAMPLLMRIYSLSPEAVRLVWIIVLSHGIIQIFIWPEGWLLPVAFRAAGDARFPMIVAIADMVFIRIISAWFLAVTFGMGMLGTWYAMYLDWLVRLVIFVPHYRSGVWLKYRAI
jgi:putative MATE family efflux protein